MADKFVYKIKEDVQLEEGEKLHVMGIGEFTKGEKIESETPLFNSNLELVSTPEKSEKKIGLDKATKAEDK
jgi:hypothetical protein